MDNKNNAKTASDKLKMRSGNDNNNQKMTTPLDFLVSLKRGWEQKAKKPYYFVPPCPVCGSFMTGRFFKEKKDDYNNDWVIKEGLKNGEIMSPTDEIGEDNVFCLECGTTWHYPVEATWFTLDEIKKQQEMRGTKEILKEFLNEDEEEEEPVKKKKKQSGLKKYIGHL